MNVGILRACLTPTHTDALSPEGDIDRIERNVDVHKIFHNYSYLVSHINGILKFSQLFSTNILNKV